MGFGLCEFVAIKMLWVLISGMGVIRLTGYLLRVGKI